MLGRIVAYNIEGYYIGTKPPIDDKAYLSTRAVVENNRVDKDNVDRESIISDLMTRYLCTHRDLLLLAGVAYGEASTQNVYEEMAGIANVLVRQMKARRYSTISDFLTNVPTYAFAATDGNQRFAAFKARQTQLVDMRDGNDGMRLAIKGAINAILEKTDYSNGAYFWDGSDVTTNFKYRKGIDYTSPSHDIYAGGDHAINKPYQYTFETTAAWGGTVFSKYTSAFVSATGNSLHN